MRLKVQVLLILLVTGPLLGEGTARADLGEEEYSLPLVGRYAIFRHDPMLARDPNAGRHQLIELSAYSSRAGLSFSDVILGVEQVAVAGDVIAGKAGKGYFLFDAGQPEAKPQFFDSPEQWKAALATAGISESIPLKSPDAIAAGLPDRVLRPWKYRLMGGRLGYSDDAWSLIVQIVGLVAAFLGGLIVRPGRSPVAAAAILGILVNIVAQIGISGGGPGACAGFIVLPLYYCLVAFVGRGIRRLAGRVGRQKAAAA